MQPPAGDPAQGQLGVEERAAAEGVEVGRAAVPVARAGDGLAPASIARRPAILAPLRLKAPVEVLVGPQVVQPRPKAHRQARGVRCPEGGRLGDRRADHRDVEEVGLELHQHVVDGGATVDPKLADLDA
mgnify:CR=1 FL=1